MDVGEVTSSATGDEDLASRMQVVFKQQNAAIALTGDSSTHQPGRAGAKDDRIEFTCLGGHFPHCRPNGYPVAFLFLPVTLT